MQGVGSGGRWGAVRAKTSRIEEKTKETMNSASHSDASFEHSHSSSLHHQNELSRIYIYI